MIQELQSTIDRADSVSILLAKSGDKYIATLVVKQPKGSDPLPPVQVTATIDKIDDEVSQAFNEVSEIYTSTADQIEQFKAAAAKSAEASKAKPTAKKTAAKKTAAKKVAKPKSASKPKPKPEAKPEDEPKDEPAVKVIPAKDMPQQSSVFDESDPDTAAALKKLGL